jgi:PKD repeat protein
MVAAVANRAGVDEAVPECTELATLVKSGGVPGRPQPAACNVTCNVSTPRFVHLVTSAGVPRSMFRLPKIRNRQHSRGQSIVEFALILPVLVFLLLVTLDVGRLFMSYITLTNVTRVAANFGATNPGAFTGTPVTTTYDAVVNRETAGLNCDLQAAGGYKPPIPTYPKGTGLTGTSVAAMTCNFSMLMPFITAFFGGPLPISASAEFPIRTGAIANIGGSTTLPPPGSPQADFNFTGVSGGTIGGSGNVSGVGSVTVNVSNTSVNAQTWDWDWGDGGPHDFVSAPPAHTYGTGPYTVALTVTNTVGSSSRSRTVTVTSVPLPPPVAGFYGTPVVSPPRYTDGGGSGGAAISGSLPLVVDFTNQSTNGAAYSWDFGDGTAASTDVSPQHQYSDLGLFSVKLTVTAPPSGTPYTRTAYITTGCVVPNFANTSTSAAYGTWTGANFSGTISYQSSTAPGGSGTSTTPPSPARNIVSQTLTGGDFVQATQQKKNDPWVCAPDIKLRYTP